MEIKTIDELNKLAGGEINIPVEDLRLVQMCIKQRRIGAYDYKAIKNLIGFVSYKKNKEGASEETLYLVDNYGKKVARANDFFCDKLSKPLKNTYNEFLEKDFLSNYMPNDYASIWDCVERPLYKANTKVNYVIALFTDDPNYNETKKAIENINEKDAITLDELGLVAHTNARYLKRTILLPEVTPEQKKRALAINAHRAKLAEIL